MEADEKVCPKCVETVKAAAVVCKHCGHTFGVDRAAPPVAPARNTSIGAKIGIGCLVLLAIPIVLGVIGKSVGNNAGSKSAPDATAPKAAAIEISAKQLDSSWATTTQFDFIV